MARLITYSYLRKETDIADSIEDKYLDNPLKMAESQLKFLLGKGFYDQIVSQNDASTLSTDNNTLYDPYIKQFLAWQAHQFWLAKANVYATRTGMRKFKEENSDAATDKEMGELLRIAKQQTELMKGEMLSFLQSEQSESASIYPLYTNRYRDSMSSGFHITAISKTDNVSMKIDQERFNNGE